MSDYFIIFHKKGEKMSKSHRYAGLVLGLGLAFFAACDDSSSDAGYSIPQYKNEAALPDTCEMEVAKVGSAYFACFEDKWIEVTDSATVEHFKEGLDEEEVKKKLKKLEKQLQPKAPAEPESSDDTEEDVESSDDAEPESSSSEECTGRRCGDSGKSSSSKNDSGDSGSGGDSGSDSGSEPEKRMCGDEVYNPETHFCTNSKEVLELCGGKEYDPWDRACEEGVLVGKCGSQTYDPETEACSSDDKVLKKCGTYTYDSQTHFCGSDNRPYQLCNGETFETQQYFCYESELYEKCGGRTYIPTRQFCWEEEVRAMALCGTTYYVQTTHYCLDETTPMPLQECGTEKYNPVAYYCKDGTTVTKKWECGMEFYIPETYYCTDDDVLMPRCGDGGYDPKTQFCGSDQNVYELCNGKTYDPTTKYCAGGKTITDLAVCNGVKYNPEKQLCAEYLNKLGFTKYTLVKYVTIGNLKWMAENWNVPVTGSVCYNDAEECDAYGRLYPKSAARKSSSCPKGWRIPTNAEAESMVATVEGTSSYSINNGATSKLKSIGFNVVYGGYYDGNDEEYALRGSSMFLWTSDCLEEGSCAFETSVSYILASRGNNAIAVYEPYNILYEMRMSIRCVADK
jgi:uncharacterized protein (TIGR02145 family)